jgi:hypothetical protein
MKNAVFWDVTPCGSTSQKTAFFRLGVVFSTCLEFRTMGKAQKRRIYEYLTPLYNQMIHVAADTRDECPLHSAGRNFAM